MKSKLTIREVDTPFGMQYSGCGEVMLYAKGWYAVRKNPVVPYADIHFNFKKVKFLYIKKHIKRDKQSQTTLFFRVLSSPALFRGHFSIYKLNNDFRGLKTRKSNKQTHQSLCL